MSTEPITDDPKWPAGYDCIVLEETDSTMREAERRQSALTAPTWIVAHCQTAARGRRGRVWANPEGNFSATLVMHPNEPPATAALRSFTTALALRQTLERYGPPERLCFKWPNDVLLDGGKVAGILLESRSSSVRIDWLAIGIGINLLASPNPDTLEPRAAPPVSLKEAGFVCPSVSDLLLDLAAGMAEWEETFVREGFDPIRRAWLRGAAKLGETITARTGREEIVGTFETVDESGALVLTGANGLRVIPAADVYF